MDGKPGEIEPGGCEVEVGNHLIDELSLGEEFRVADDEGNAQAFLMVLPGVIGYVLRQKGAFQLGHDAAGKPDYTTMLPSLINHLVPVGLKGLLAACMAAALMSYMAAALTHNHYCLNDTRLLELLPIAAEKNIGIINAAPFASGLLTDRGPADWHPASQQDRTVFKQAADFCRTQGTNISQLAMQFSSQNPDVKITMFSSADPELVKRNVAWHDEPYDPELVTHVQTLLVPVFNKQWGY